MSSAERAAKQAAAGKAAKARSGRARQDRTRDEEMPAAGPHAKPHLVDQERTPGAGSLARPGDPRDGDATG